MGEGALFFLPHRALERKVTDFLRITRGVALVSESEAEVKNVKGLDGMPDGPVADLSSGG